jgi:tetratricopeptide (TPR) repeat protein
MARVLAVLWLVVLALTVAESGAACDRPAGVITALDRGYQHLYNLQFEEAHRAFDTWERAYPSDPMGPVAHAAAYLFAELDRLHLLASELFMDDERFVQRTHTVPDPAVMGRFERTVAVALSQTDYLLAQRPEDSQALLAKIFALGLRADAKALLTHQYLQALADMKASRILAERLVGMQPACYDAYLAIGVENYLLSVKPIVVRWLLRLGGAQTNRTLGVAMLQLTAAHGHYLQPYARLLLAVAALRDGNRDRARALLADLAQEFPHNQLYAMELERLH